MQQEISTLLDTYLKGLYRGDIALLHRDGRWHIVNKLFMHVEA